MKRLLSIIVCVLLVAALATPAFAAGTTSFSMSASGSAFHRGDTITVTVSVSSSEPATSYGLMLSYDSSALELVNGSCTVSGTLVSSFNNGFAFMFQTATAYSGSIGTVTFKVKENASFGSYTISGAASVKNGSASVDASGSSVTISISCEHSYVGWSKANETAHKRTCSICKKEEIADHTWNSGTITKQPSCKETGVTTFTCTGCGATKTESIAKTTTHSYGGWIKISDTQHKHTCAVCQKEEIVVHTWDGGNVTKQPNCKEEGVKTYTCTACSATKTEAIAKTITHSYGSWTSANDSQHKHTCSVCSRDETANHTWNSGIVTKRATCKEEGVKTYTCTACNATKIEPVAKLTTHTYNHDCDADCNVCGAVRTITHQYKTSWSKDKDNHWHECSVCGEKKDVVSHTPGAEATEMKAQTCSTCGYVIKAALGHEHNYATTWTTDANGHWYACSGCEERSHYTAHDFENACDKDCSICDFVRDTEHTLAETWTTDATNHWHVCAGCGLKQEEATHEPGAEATATTAQTCTICGYEIAPAIGTEEVNNPTENITATEPTTSSDQSNANIDDHSFSGWVVIPMVAAIAVGAIMFIIKKKKI